MIGDRFGFIPDPDHPGWQLRRANKKGRFVDIFGDIRVRIENERTARCRVDVDSRHRNINDTVHGGFILALIDQALFIGPAALAIPGAAGGVTLDLSTQFFAPVSIGKPVEAVVELLRETRRFIFMRGAVEQDGAAAVAFLAKILKAR